jgi:hypothetical protein
MNAYNYVCLYFTTFFGTCGPLATYTGYIETPVFTILVEVGIAMKKATQKRSIGFLLIIPLLILSWIGCSDENSPVAPVENNQPPPVTTVDTIPPAGVTELVVKAPGVRSLGLQWVAPGNDGWDGTATEYDVRYSTEPIDESNWDQALRQLKMPCPVPGLRVQKCRATKLEPATTYYFAMKARDQDNNESGISNLAYGTTIQESMPPSSVTDLEVSELPDGRLMLSWTARGDDGDLGSASTYDVRYHTYSVIDANNWSEATRVTNDLAPGPSGTKETLVLDVDIPERNHSFAIMVGDEVTNWSKLSNYALSLGTESYLWAYPQNIRKGDKVTVVFRAPGDEQVDIELFGAVGLCGTGDLTLYSGLPEAGIHTVEFDFYNRNTGEYWNPNWYQISVCIGGQRRDLNRVQFTF